MRSVDRLGFTNKSRPPAPITPTGLIRSSAANAIPPAILIADAYLLIFVEETVIEADVSRSK